MAGEAVLRAATPPNVTKKLELWREIVKNRWAYVFISPFYILFLIFGVFPVLFSAYLSFHDWNGMGPMEFVGLKNYEFLLGAGGKVFWDSILNGVVLFFMYVPLMTFLALVLAVILNSQRVRFFRLYRMMIFAPYVTSMIAAGFTFRLMFETNDGLINVLLNALGLQGVPWLADYWWARVTLCLLVIWGWLGYNMVLMLTGLQTIPRELTEAAMIDGASAQQVFFHITIPLLRPVIVFSVTLSVIGTFGLFNEVQALFNSSTGPLRTALIPIVHIFNVGFGDFKFGRASAMGYVYFGIVFLLTLVQLKYIGGREVET